MFSQCVFRSTYTNMSMLTLWSVNNNALLFYVNIADVPTLLFEKKNNIIKKFPHSISYVNRISFVIVIQGFSVNIIKSVLLLKVILKSIK